MSQKTDKLFKRAKVNLEENNHDNALRLINEVLNREPTHKEALRTKALIKILEGDKEESERFLLFAVKQQPDDDELHQMLATFYYNNEQPQKALEQFKKALSLNEANATAHQGIAMLYANVYGEHEKAIAHYSRTIELGKNSDDLFFNRGCSYMLLNQMDNAEDDLRKAEKMGHPNASEMIEKYFS